MSTSLFIILFTACSTESSDTAPEKTNVSTPESWARQEILDMEKHVQNSSPLTSINELEDLVLDIENDLLYTWTKSWKQKEASLYQARLLANGLQWNQESQVETTTEGIEEHQWTPNTGSDSANTYLSQFSQIDSLQISVLEAKQIDKNVELELLFQLRGIHNGYRQHDRGTLRLSVTNANEKWMIQSITAENMERLRATREPIFTDATSTWGLGDIPRSDRKEAIRRGGYALAAVDYNNDARTDLLVGHYGTVQLLQNTGSGFVDVTEKEGLSSENIVKSAAIADIDGDGDNDILLLRFVDTDNNQTRDFVAYENKGEGASPRFQARRDVLPRSRDYDRAMPLTLADFNNDGTLDIYIGFPGIRDFTSGIANRERPAEQASQGMWLNQGNWEFTESTTGVIDDNSVYAHAALASDLNNDGKVELLVVDDSGRINPMYKQNETGDYVNVAKDSGIASNGMSMGISTGDFNGDGLLDIMSTNVTLRAGERLLKQAQNFQYDNPKYKSNFQTIQDGYSSLMLYQNNGDGSFTPVQDNQLQTWHGEAAASGEWIDYNHDGLLDYYLPNGLWSSGPEKLDSLFFRYDITSFPDPLYTGITTDHDFGSSTMRNDVHGGSSYVVSKQEQANPILRLLRSHRDENQKLSLSLGGYQHNALFRNNGDGTFTEVGYLENADRLEDGYIVAPIDVDNDGRQDLVMRNTDPALEHSYAPVVLLKNNHRNARSACVRLPKDKMPFGARVTATINGKKHVREIRSVNGAVQAEPIAMFGLGTAQAATDVTIHWPDGSKTDLGTISTCVQ